MHVALAHVVEQAARGGGDDLDAVLERFFLGGHGHAAVNAGGAQAAVLAEELGLLLNL